LIGAAVRAILGNPTACGWLWSNGARQQETCENDPIEGAVPEPAARLPTIFIK
jgi:hypothetical protein